ncbi:MAG TPA: bifunctional metallophosphatase/5'-nucleotidase, partial [Rhodoferax sp.]|nr:bifunctional metallophosphatase/5'-nucleotidase [Rhodoferax sp.]
MHKGLLKAPALVRTAVAGCIALLLSSTGHGAEVRLRILETTDVHMNLLSYDYYQDKATDQYGLSRAVSLIKAARA